MNFSEVLYNDKRAIVVVSVNDKRTMNVLIVNDKRAMNVIIFGMSYLRVLCLSQMLPFRAFLLNKCSSQIILKKLLKILVKILKNNSEGVHL